MSRPVRFAIVSMACLAVLVVYPPPVLADHLHIEATFPESVQSGDIVDVRVLVSSADTDQPVPGAIVSASRDTSFLGVSDRIDIASTTTDERGVAHLRWQIRSGASELIVLAYSQAGEEVVESEPLSFVTVTPGPQLVRSSAGVRIPGFGAWVLVILLVGIWATIQFALLGPVAVARAGEVARQNGEDGGQ